MLYGHQQHAQRRATDEARRLNMIANARVTAKLHARGPAHPRLDPRLEKIEVDGFGRVPLEALAHIQTRVVRPDSIKWITETFKSAPKKVPPIILRRAADPSQVMLADGNHRLTVARVLGLSDIAVAWAKPETLAAVRRRQR